MPKLSVDIDVGHSPGDLPLLVEAALLANFEEIKDLESIIDDFDDDVDAAEFFADRTVCVAGDDERVEGRFREEAGRSETEVAERGVKNSDVKEAIGTFGTISGLTGSPRCDSIFFIVCEE